MTLPHATLLALVQGATEFLPVSSSGHVALAGKLLGLEQTPLDFVVAVHLGTLLSVAVYYREDLWAMVRGVVAGRDAEPGLREHRKLAALLILATIPAALAGYFLEDAIDAALGNTRAIGCALLFTALTLAVASRLGGDRALQRTGPLQALLVGIAQAGALIPGVSRSGCTIAGGLACGFSRDWAPRFAFLLAIPAIVGGTLLQVLRLVGGNGSDGFDPVTYLVGVLVAAVVGYLSIILVIDSVRRGNLLYYCAYCAAVGLAAILWSAAAAS